MSRPATDVRPYGTCDCECDYCQADVHPVRDEAIKAAVAAEREHYARLVVEQALSAIRRRVALEGQQGAIDAAVAAERERCAKIVENADNGEIAYDAFEVIAAKIRNAG